MAEFKSQPLPVDPNAESGLRITDRFRTELGRLGFIPLLMNHTVVDAAHPGARYDQSSVVAVSAVQLHVN